MVLPNIEMNPPQVYMCSPSWSLLPPPSPYHPSGLSQCTSPKHPVSCIEPGLATRFIYDIIRISMPFSRIILPSPYQVTVLFPFLNQNPGSVKRGGKEATVSGWCKSSVSAWVWVSWKILVPIVPVYGASYLFSSKTSSFWLSYTWQPLLVSTQQILTKHTLCLGTSKDFSYHPVTIFWGHWTPRWLPPGRKVSLSICPLTEILVPKGLG